jgi:hypothetical protein
LVQDNRYTRYGQKETRGLCCRVGEGMRLRGRMPTLNQVLKPRDAVDGRRPFINGVDLSLGTIR